MKRWHEEEHITRRNWRNHWRLHYESNLGHYNDGKDPEEIDCVCDTQIGRFRKTDAFDCGKTRCYGCHCDKFPTRYPTYQEWCAELKLEEGIKELQTKDRVHYQRRIQGRFL